MALHWSGIEAAPLTSPRQDETSEPLSYAGWMAGPYRVEDATRGRNDDPVTSGIRASRSKAKSFEGCRSSVRMTMHEVMHEMVVGECHKPNSEGSDSAWKAYMNAKVAGLFLLVLLEYPNDKGVDETSEPLSNVRWMADPYRVKDAMRGRNDDPVTSGIRASRSKATSFEGCRSSVRMTKHEVMHEMVAGECHEPNSKGSGSAWKAYINARVAGLFLLVLLEYPNGKGVVHTTSRDSIWHYTGREFGPLP
ncbi:hypothetical protein Tco_1290805 [Tanacetum coccineum]